MGVLVLSELQGVTEVITFRLSFLLGMEVSRDRGKRALEVRQTGYLKSVLERFGMTDCRPSYTPAERYITPGENADKQVA